MPVGGRLRLTRRVNVLGRYRLPVEDTAIKWSRCWWWWRQECWTGRREWGACVGCAVDVRPAIVERHELARRSRQLPRLHGGGGRQTCLAHARHPVAHVSDGAGGRLVHGAPACCALLAAAAPGSLRAHLRPRACASREQGGGGGARVWRTGGDGKYAVVVGPGLPRQQGNDLDGAAACHGAARLR